MMAAVWGNLREGCTMASRLSRSPGTLMRYNIGEREKKGREDGAQNKQACGAERRL